MARRAPASWPTFAHQAPLPRERKPRKFRGRSFYELALHRLVVRILRFSRAAWLPAGERQWAEAVAAGIEKAMGDAARHIDPTARSERRGESPISGTPVAASGGMESDLGSDTTNAVSHDAEDGRRDEGVR